MAPILGPVLGPVILSMDTLMNLDPGDLARAIEIENHKSVFDVRDNSARSEFSLAYLALDTPVRNDNYATRRR